MEKGIYEPKYRRNGIESPVHCILMNINTPFLDIVYHYHEYIEILYGLNTDGYVYINDKCHRFKDGDLVIINSGENHCLRFENVGSTYIVIKVLPELIYSSEQTVFEMKYLMPFLIESSRNKRFFTACEIGSREVHEIITRIMREWSNEEYGYEMSIRSDILKLFLWVLRYWKNNGLSPVMTFDYPDELLSVIQLATEYVSQNYAYATAEQAARECNLSYSYFSRTFKSVMNQSFTKYLNDYRITKAEQLILSTDKSISEIAEEVGFSTPSYFIQQFRAKKGISPKQFRLNALVSAKQEGK